MDKLYLLVLLLILLVPSTPVAAASGVDPDLSALTEAVDDLDAALGELLPSFSLKGAYAAVLDGDFSFDFMEFLKTLWIFVCGEIRVFLALLSQLLLLGLAAAIFGLVGEGIGGGNAAKVGNWVIYLAFILVALKALRLGLELGGDGIEQASSFLYAVLPILLGSFALTGGTVAAAVVQPSILTAVTVFLGLMERFFMPLLLLMAALALCTNIAPAYSFRKLFELVRDVILIGVALMMTIFTGILGLSSFAAGTVDGLTLKTVKMATGNFIPVVGSYLADALDAIIGAGMLLRSSIGIFGVGAVALIVILPGIRILVMALFFKVASALLQPFGDNGYVTALSDFAAVLLTLFALVAVTGLLFFFFIFCVIGVSSMTMMLR